MTLRDAKALGYAIRILRQYMNGIAGWSYEVTHLGGPVIIEGWTVGLGPLAKQQAMRDALRGIDSREVLRSFIPKAAAR